MLIEVEKAGSAKPNFYALRVKGEPEKRCETLDKAKRVSTLVFDFDFLGLFCRARRRCMGSAGLLLAISCLFIAPRTITCLISLREKY